MILSPVYPPSRLRGPGADPPAAGPAAVGRGEGDGGAAEGEITETD